VERDALLCENLAQLARREAGYTRADSPSCGPLLAATAAGVFAGAVEASDLSRRIEMLSLHRHDDAMQAAVADVRQSRQLARELFEKLTTVARPQRCSRSHHGIQLIVAQCGWSFECCHDGPHGGMLLGPCYYFTGLSLAEPFFL